MDCIGQGLPILLPKGARVIQLLQRWVEDTEQQRGYLLTKTPLMAKRELYKISGHWDHYLDGMFIMGDPADETKEQMLARDPLAGTGKIVSPTPDRITKLGIARTFQNIRLWKSMTVFENVLVAKHMRARQNVFSATFRGNAKEEKRMRDETMALLVEQGLEKYKDDIATSLPYGIQRRLEIARALATDPKLLLLDEPAAGMNPQETLELAAFIHELREKYGLTIFLIEHHMDLVMRISDYIYVIDFGSKIAEGIPQEVQNNQHVIDAYLGVVEDE